MRKLTLMLIGLFALAGPVLAASALQTADLSAQACPLCPKCPKCQ
jgi:hypothetical protein